MLATSALQSALSGLALGIGSWLTSSDTRCRCECHIGGVSSPDDRIIGLLQRQLDRCGPANLTAAPQVPLSGPAAPPWVLLGVVFVLGVVFGALLVGVLTLRSARRAPTVPERAATAPAFTSPRVAATPSTFRAGARLPSALLG